MSVAPLRFGAGMKGKVGESLAHGLPVVATPIAIEGTGLEHGKQVSVATSPQEFAQAVVRLYGDEELWGSLSESGRAYVQGRYSPEAVQDAVQRLFERLVAR